MAKAIQLKDSNNLALLPITDSKLVQHWNGTTYIPASDYLHPDHNDLQTLSYTNGGGIKLSGKNDKIDIEGSGLITITGSNNKMVIGTTATNNTGTVTSVTPGSGLLNGTGTTAITGSGMLNVALKDYTKNAADATTADTSGGTLEPVQLDKSGKLAVYIKDTHNNHTITWSGSNYTPNTTTGPTSVNVISYYNSATNTLNPNGTISYTTVTVPTIKYVDDKIGSAIHLKGTVGPSGADITSLPTQNVKEGDAYLVYLTSGTNTTILSGQTLENGDLIIATSEEPTWTVIQNNLSIATSSKAGTVKPGTTSGQNYGVSVATDGAMTVNVPWTDNDHTSSVKLSGSKGSNNVISNVTLSSATSGNNTEYTLAVTYSSITSNVTSSIFVGASNSTSTTAVAAQGPAYILHKEGSSVNSKVGFVGDNTWIQVSYSPVNSNIKFEHIGPGTGTATNAVLDSTAVTASTTTTSLTHGSSVVLTGVKFKKDSKGHITELSYSLGKLPADNNTDEKVKEIGKSDSKTYPVLFSNTNTNATSSGKTADYVASDTDGTTNFWYNPSTNILHAKYVNTDDSVSVSKGVTSNLNYVQGKDITLDDTFLSNALGSTTSNVTGATSSGTATVVVNHAAS